MTSHCGNPYRIHCPLQAKSVEERFVRTSVSAETGCVGRFALIDFSTIEFNGRRITRAGPEAEGKNG